jgi:hypothetical protein
VKSGVPNFARHLSQPLANSELVFPVVVRYSFYMLRPIFTLCTSRMEL